MPLTRLHVRNEYGLGDASLYRVAKRDDPKSALEGVSVSGLVGILRQLGDLAEFAAEIFNDLHEQVMGTAMRGHNMIIRVQRLEADLLPPIEKVATSQKSHIHFAYTEGSDWHTKIKTKQNHIAHGDSPQFIMESYAECREPPRLFLLDKFDAAGAGACLKRYSDPSFFKMAQSSSELMKEENVLREKKGHKHKKIRQQQSNGVTIAHLNSRVMFPSSDTDDQSSAEFISTSDMQLKSDMANRCISFDSIPSLNSEQCADLEEPVQNEFPTSKLKMRLNDTVASILDKKHGVQAENDSRNRTLQCQNISGSSSVTWDEKTEILKPAGQLHENICHPDSGQAPEPLPVNSSQYKLEQNVDGFAHVDQSTVSFNVENMAEYFCSKKKIDEIPSETDYMDALNTMESEIETDTECQTKWEVELQSNFKHQQTVSTSSGKYKVSLENSESPEVSPVSLYSASNQEISPKISDTNATNGSFYAQPPQITTIITNHDCSIETGFLRSFDRRGSSRVNCMESVNGILSSVSSSSCPEGNKATVGLCIPEESSKISKASATKCCTNGNFFGVGPSKPPEISVSKAINQNCTSDTTNYKGDGSASKSGVLVQPIESTYVESRSSESIVPDDVPEPSTTFNSDNMKLQEGPHYIGQNKGQTGIASMISQTSTLNGQCELTSQEYSIPCKSSYTFHPSPPLEHMQISFHPINDWETSKMKLKFPHTLRHQENVQDVMFSSFQLLPENAMPVQDVGSGSDDDDTFCRSSLYPSEDLRSLRSESNSEQWESGELTGSIDHEMDGGFHRTSSTASISGHLELDEEAHHKIHSSDGFRSPDAPDGKGFFDSNLSLSFQKTICLDSSMSQREGKSDSGPSDFASLCPNELPPPPPLPPPQWRMTTLNFASVESQQHAVSNQPTDQQVRASIMPLPPKPPAPPKQCYIEGSCPDKSKQEPKKRNECREPKQAANGMGKDQREDLLHQIRTKSSSLRRTVTTRPSFIPGPATNINVVAILEKANAIRQACASSDDDGDDENWSDG